MSTGSDEQDLRGRYAARILDISLRKRYAHLIEGRPRGGDDLPQLPDVPPAPRTPDPALGKICIIGAGITGLYLAMMCDYLDISYDLLESSNRVGGRIYTHKFPETGTPINHNYYDVGAMRYPDIPVMEP